MESTRQVGSATQRANKLGTGRNPEARETRPVATQLELPFPDPLPGPRDVWDATAHALGIRPAWDRYRKHLELGYVPEPLAARLNARNASVRQGARLDLHLLRLLGLSVGTDAIATADYRWLASHVGRNVKQVRKRLTRLVNEGSLQLVRRGRSHTAAAYLIPDFEAFLDGKGELSTVWIKGGTKGGTKTPANRSARASELRIRNSEKEKEGLTPGEEEDPDASPEARAADGPRSAAGEESLYAGRDRVTAAPAGLLARPKHWTWAEWDDYQARERGRAHKRRSAQALAELERMERE